jgi:putative ABC transport system permease protein
MMFGLMVRRALARGAGARALTAVTTALGATVATALLSVQFGVADRVAAELQAYGANIVVRPKAAAVVAGLYEGAAVQAGALREDEVANVKQIFWAFNITAFAPFLEATTVILSEAKDLLDEPGISPTTLTGTWFDHTLTLPSGETATAGVAALKPWWQVEGTWPRDAAAEALAGAALAAARGWTVGVKVALTDDIEVTVTGIVTSGDEAEAQLIVPLDLAQAVAGRPGEVDRIEVAALTTPDNDLALRAARNPASLSVSERETWYCTAYASAIAYQLEEVLTDAVAKPVRAVTEAQGAILTKTQAILLLVTVLALAASALAIANLVTASVMERAAEIGLLKAVGAPDGAVVRLVLTELTVTGLAGGLAGYGLGLAAAQAIGWAVFGSAIPPRPAVAALVGVGVVAVVVAGSLPAVRFLLRLKPAEVLHGR